MQPPVTPVKRIHALHNNQISEIDDNDADVELLSPNHFFSTHVNLIPLQSGIQGPRLFYGARFYNQALPLVKPQAPLVQSLDTQDPDGLSFDEKLGRAAGAVSARDDGLVEEITPDYIRVKGADGLSKNIDLYNNFIFNRKTSITHTPLVKAGDAITKGQILARSNYTDDNGTLALGTNARVGLVPHKGQSMDDAIVISKAFSNRLTSDHAYTVEQDFDNDTKGGLSHYVSLFPTQFTKDKLKNFSPNGVIKPGARVKQGDPLILATRPRVFSSTTAQLGNLSKAMRQSRHDSSQKWDSEFDGVVTDVAKTKTGYKVVVKSEAPAQQGDKIVFRSGQKGVISSILPDEHMPRTVDGQPLEVLLNPLGVPSRVNNGIIYELLLGKAAAAAGKPIKVPSFNKKGEKWYDMVQKALQDQNLAETEQVFDPMSNRLLENPITVGMGHILKLHHTSASKSSARGQGSYDAEQQPLKGGSDSAQAKRLSGLEVHSLLSAGAYATLREGATLRGQKNDEYWRSLRQGYKPKPPGTPFVWDKFQSLLTGAGLHARKIPGGKLRLGPFTDDELDKRQPIDVKSGELVDLHTLEPTPGGLFDSTLVGSNKWGRITLPFKVPNPAFENSIRHLLGLTERELRGVLSGQMELPQHLR